MTWVSLQMNQGGRGVLTAVGVGFGLVAGVSLYSIWKRYRRHCAISRLVPGFEASALGGNMSQIMKAGGLLPFLVELHESFGSVAMFSGPLFSAQVSINDPLILSEMGALRLDKDVNGLNFLKGLLGPRGVGYLGGAAAKRRRGILMRIFEEQPIDDLLPLLLEAIERKVKEWGGRERGNGDVEVQSEIQPLWMELNAFNVFGSADVSTMALSRKFQQALQLLMVLRYKPFVLPFSSEWRKKRRLLREVHEELRQIMEPESSKRGFISSSFGKEREMTNSVKAPANEWKARGGDLLGMLLNELQESKRKENGRKGAKGKGNEPGGIQCLEDVRDEVLTFLFGTFDNYVIVSNVLYYLAANPECQSRAREEVKSRLCKDGKLDDTKLSVEALRQLTYIRNCIRESLRITPVGGVTWRLVSQRTTLRLPPLSSSPDHPASLELLPGDSVVIPMISIHRNPAVWDRPFEFLPDRWEERRKTEGSASSILSFIPFGLGMRACLGQRFAQDLTTLILCVVLSQFSVKLVGEGGPHGEAPQWGEQNFTYMARGGLFLSFQHLN
uniref:Cytochrome P450 n=1 Tax=Chromera velia CCMP2878 TaxID=1169474 RepID=A0A0G4HU27_9ALVE|eukprot:Cvel_31586.t1-p1 / transcript=Cvel_31586.t1 / gene=Cvel_31586 / organism=Chromera_velia_CCMP2878 / gene_product=Probable cytochrome P450 312a1, putative / transcript_product=Probable cytochrome P450 312a1, putative / location=Cvel_scaffold4735:2543-4452(-) / protein_length=556 / sequence_SO=supercontig / SO=protein_coding / is_pseudo=false